MDGVTVMDRALVDSARTVPGQGKRVAGRLTGIDVARGLAVLGMYAVHVGPEPAKGGVGVLFKPFEGHSAALFAVLAGVSIALMSGGRRPKLGRDRTRVALKLATRAPLLVALGLWLTSLETGYMVILAYYGACFLFAIPWLRAGAKALAIASVVVAVVGPLLSHLIRIQLLPRDLLFFAPDLTADDVTSTGLLKAATVLVLTGTFPALTLIAYVFAGMAIGRMDLTSRSVCRRLFFGGSGLAVGGYLVSWIATGPLGGMQAVYRSLEPAAAQMGMTPQEFFRLHQTWIHGTPPTTSWAWELLPTGTSYTPFDLLISIGIAAAVIGGCQLLMPKFERVLRPLSDLGGRVLSAYVLHFVAIALLWDGSDGDSIFSVLHFVEFSVVALTGAVLWRKFVGRGPLEWAMNKLSSWPKHLFADARVPAQRRG